MNTYSYVVQHDCGFAPNPQKGICTLVYCKFQQTDQKRRNIVELASVSDVIVGTGGSDNKLSTGHGTLIYIMKVTDKIPFSDYIATKRYYGRVDCKDEHLGNKYALISKEFIYFGEKAIKINELPKQFRNIEKKGPGFRYKGLVFIGDDLYDYLKKKYGTGMKGKPTCNDDYDMHPGECSRPSAPAGAACRKR